MKLITRERAIEDSNFASFLSEWQNLENPEEEDYMRIEGEYFDNKIDSFRFFPQSELDEYHNDELEEFKSKIDITPKFNPEILEKIVIDAPDNSENINYTTTILTKFISLHELKLIFIPLYKTDWFNDKDIKHHYPNTKNTYKKLKSLVKKNSYNGGFLIKSELSYKKFLPLLFKLIECNYYKYNFFYSEKLKIVFSYHYSGQIWCYCFEANGVKAIVDYIEKKKLILNKEYSTLCKSSEQ